MKKKLSKDRVYALRGWSIKTERGKFFAAPTVYFNDKEKWHGPYKSLQSATTAIARKLQEEFTKRNAKLEAHHGQ